MSTASTSEEESQSLLNQLLQSVQQCQKRFGGKTELATESDQCVASLCLNLEAVFSHGLRNKPQDLQTVSALKHVSEIVTNSLHLGTENPSCWPFVSKHLIRHEQERYTSLKHIWTDIGRGRAWLRSVLNERSLERYFHTVLSNQDVLVGHYESWALLRDHEKNSMLPNMAAGLNSILFAISIDKPEFNSGVSPYRVKLRSTVEPIIEAPLADSNKDRTKTRRKKKVAKQFISFDDEESNLSSSLPSSSGSLTSETNSIPEKTFLKHNKPRRKMTDNENSTPINTFPTITEAKLTPISQASVGELTPVSVETRTTAESPDSDPEETIEVPTDISAVLAVVERQNKQEVGKLTEKIAVLGKENGLLKEQVQKYMHAIRGLDRGTEDDGVQVVEANEEVKHYEEKLVQIAEMHAEIMDFNCFLQQSLAQKDALLERLKAELDELRGPMPLDDVNLDDSRCVNAWIPSAFLTGTGSNEHHVYQIYLRAGSDEWNIYRRYSQFHALHKDLKKLDAVVSTFNFPPKKSMRNKDSALVEDRRKRLQIYMRKVLHHWPELSHCNSRYLLEQHLPFFKDQSEGDQRSRRENKRSIFSSKRSQNNENHYSGL